MSAYDAALTEDALVTVADLRARGASWDATAEAVGWEVADLRRAVRRESEFERYYEEALREVRREIEAEMLLTYRKQLRDEDSATARKAADALARYGAGLERDRTRLEVENIRAGVARAKLDAKRARDEPEWPAEPKMDVTVLTPEQVHTPDDESAYARRATDKQAVVWLWGGAHKIGDTEPDAATDTPLVLIHDMTAPPPERQRYWAIRFPIPGHPTEGPYPIPGAFEPVPELTPEQARQIADFAARAPAPAA